MTLIRIILIWTTIPFFIFGLTTQDAERYYKNGDYNQSQIIYNELIQKNPSIGPLWYNLGNAYLKSNELGKAIFAYRKSAQLMGYDSDLSKNLALARQQVINQITDQDSFLIILRNRLMTLSLVTWFWLANGILFILLISYILLKRQCFRVELLRNLFLIFLIFTVCSWSVLGALYYHQLILKHSVVIAEKSAVKSGPSQKLPTLFYIHEGIELTLLQQSNNWVKIKLSNGLQGWVRLDHMALI